MGSMAPPASSRAMARMGSTSVRNAVCKVVVAISASFSSWKPASAARSTISALAYLSGAEASLAPDSFFRKLDDPMTAATPVLRFSGISKSFPGAKASSEVSLELYAGQVKALVGENGAGKSTIVKVLTGIYQPDAGVIEVDGVEMRFASPHAASDAGVTAIHQETVLFDELSVAENIFIGHAPRGRFGLIDRGAINAQARALLARIGADLDPGVKLRDLGIASKHLVAIARALSVDARVVIMDEPTAALSYKEINELYELVERLKAEGKAILFISHKFDEVFRIADRYTVFRDGAFIGAGLITDVNEAQLVQMMVGRAVDQIFPKRVHHVGEPVLTVAGYSQRCFRGYG